MELPYIHIDKNHVAMPQTDPFTILVYGIQKGNVTKINVQTKDGTLFVTWSNEHGTYKARQAEQPQSQRRLINELNEELESLQARKYILTLSNPGKNRPLNKTNPVPKDKTTQPRRDKVNYYLDIAETVSKRSTCLRRQYGAIIVKNDEIVSTGYNGAPRGTANCSDLNYCLREKNNIPHGERYEDCRAIHAELNAIISASRNEMLDSTLYLVGTEQNNYVIDASPCKMCRRAIINAGIKTVIVRDSNEQYRTFKVEDWIETNI